MKSRYITKLAVGLAALYLSGCSTVKLPDLDLLKMSFSPERLDITIKSDEDFTRDVEALKARVRAYKADDPQ